MLYSTHALKAPQPRRSLLTTKQPVFERPANRVSLRLDALSGLSSLLPYRPELQQRDHPALGHARSSQIHRQLSACPQGRRTESRKLALPIFYTRHRTLGTVTTIKRYKSQTQFTPISQISFGNVNKIPSIGTDGGHACSTTLGALQNGIELDPSLFNSCSINATTKTMTIGGTVIFCEVLPALQAAGNGFRKFANIRQR